MVGGAYCSDADGLAGALKNKKCVKVRIYHTGKDIDSLFRIVCLMYVIYVIPNRWWRLWCSMRIVDGFGMEKVVTLYDFII